MRALEQQQAQELLSIPYDPNAPSNGSLQHLAVSAPTTPPRVNAVLNGDMPSGIRPNLSQHMDAESLLRAVGSAADKRKSVTYAPIVNRSPDVPPGASTNGFARTIGAKSMPASRRTSASGDDEDLAGHLQGLSMIGERSNRGSPAPGFIPHSILKGGGRYVDEDGGAHYGKTYNAGMMLDEQLDQEMHSTFCSHLSFLVSCF
jgi:hypothetical protein